jgi:hypothetical protein
MKSFNKIIILLYSCLVIVGCHNSDNDQISIDYTDAIQFKKNNYWVYEFASIDLESEIKLPELDDSIYIEKDTVIDSKIYYKFRNAFGLNELKTKGSGTIADLNGDIEFSATDFADTIYRDDNLRQYGMMKDVKELIEVPAGKFKTVMFIVFERNSGHAHGIDSSNPSFYNKDFSIVSKTWYAKNVGIVKSVFYFDNITAFEKNLLRYRVNG